MLSWVVGKLPSLKCRESCLRSNVGKVVFVRVQGKLSRGGAEWGCCVNGTCLELNFKLYLGRQQATYQRLVVSNSL